MSTAAAVSRSSSAPVQDRPGILARRIAGPIKALLVQGISPRKMAATLATGSVCSLFPFLGFTSLLNLGVGPWLRMNQPILQTLNQLLGPLQLVMILVYVRVGEVIWGAEPFRFSIGEMTATFREENFAGFLEKFGMAGIHAFTAWTLTAPVLFGVVFLVFNPLMRSWAKVDQQPESSS